MLKLSLISVILLSSYFFGIFLSAHLDEREYQLSILLKDLNEIKRQLTVYKTETNAIIYRIFKCDNKTELINMITQNKIYKSLENEEKYIIFEYLNSFGSSNIETELNKISSIIDDFSDIKKRHCQIKKSRKKLYRTLSLSFALIVSVLLV